MRILDIQQSLLQYIADEFVDYNFKRQKGENALNKKLEEYNFSINAFSIGKVDKFDKNVVYCLFRSMSSVEEPRTLGGGNSNLYRATMSLICNVDVNSQNSLILYNVMNEALYHCVNEWTRLEKMDLCDFSIHNYSITVNEPLFNYVDSIYTLLNFSSITCLKFVIDISFDFILM